jgi:hypothetical protein
MKFFLYLIRIKFQRLEKPLIVRNYFQNLNVIMRLNKCELKPL